MAFHWRFNQGLSVIKKMGWKWTAQVQWVREVYEIVIPEEALAGKLSAILTEIPSGESAALLERIHNKGYKMECVEARKEADPRMKEACARFVEESPQVFFRVIKGTMEEQPIYGLGVWADKASFEGCGGFDMNAKMTDGIKEEGVSFSQNSVGEFTIGDTCLAREESDHDHDLVDRIEAYYTLDKLLPKGFGAWGIEQDESYEDNGCKRFERFSIVFAEIKDSDSFSGMFKIAEGASGDCGSPEGEKNQEKIMNLEDGESDRPMGEYYQSFQFPIKFVPIPE